MAPHARVILATYNQVPMLRRVLPGYLRQTTTDFSLVLADDGSGQEQLDFIREYVPKYEARGIRLEHIWHEDEGWQKNRIMNEAVRQANSETLLIFSDADCIPPAEFVARHIEAHEPRSFQVAGAYRLSKATTSTLSEADVIAGRHEQMGTAVDRDKLHKLARKSRWGTLLRRKHRPKVIGLNMAMDRELFEAVNGFDEVFQWPYVGEDTDLRDRVMRLRPRPVVKVLYTTNDVFHLWHPEKSTTRRDNLGYYKQKRPARCVAGLV